MAFSHSLGQKRSHYRRHQPATLNDNHGTALPSRLTHNPFSYLMKARQLIAGTQLLEDSQDDDDRKYDPMFRWMRGLD